MILMKIYIDIPEGAQDFFPDEYMPSDMIRFTCSDFVDLDSYIDNICEFLKGAAHERTKTREKEKRQKNIQKSRRQYKADQH